MTVLAADLHSVFPAGCRLRALCSKDLFCCIHSCGNTLRDVLPLPLPSDHVKAEEIESKKQTHSQKRQQSSRCLYTHTHTHTHTQRITFPVSAFSSKTHTATINKVLMQGVVYANCHEGKSLKTPLYSLQKIFCFVAGILPTFDEAIGIIG